MNIWDKNRVLQEILSADEIYNSPAFIRILDEKVYRLDQIIGIYTLNEDIECGIKSCRTRHQKGYMISTTTGNTANIGNICGRKIFGAEFAILKNKFHKDLNRKKQRDFLSEFNIDEYELKINRLLDDKEGAKWAHKLISDLSQPPLVPEVVYKKIRDIKRTGNANIEVEREATQEEKERDRAIGRRVQEYVVNVVGTIKFTSVLTEDSDLKKLLITDSLQPMQELKRIDVHSLVDSKLNDLNKRIRGVESNINKAKSVMADARGFLTKSNLKILLELTRNDKESHQLFRQFLERLPD